MITQDDLPMMDYGLSVFYNNNKSYTLVGNGNLKEYPVGGLICEFCRLAPTELKEVIQLYFFDKLTVQEIARLLGRHHSTVQESLNNAIKNLKKVF